MSGPYSTISAPRTPGSVSVTWWPMVSASITTAPSAASARATVLLPLPARPTSPTMKSPSPAFPRRGRSVDIEPRRAAPDRHHERHGQRITAFHFRAHLFGHGVRLHGRALQHQLVVHLEQQSSGATLLLQDAVDANHRELHEI